MKLMFTNPDGSIGIVVAAPKETIEKELRMELTIEEYRQMVILKSVPSEATSIKELEGTIPADREFRAAWCDKTESQEIDIDLGKAKEIKLAELREKRDELLKEEDIKLIRAIELGMPTEDITTRKQELREITEPLKALDCEGKYNDLEVLNRIKELGEL